MLLLLLLFRFLLELPMQFSVLSIFAFHLQMQQPLSLVFSSLRGTRLFLLYSLKVPTCAAACAPCVCCLSFAFAFSLSSFSFPLLLSPNDRPSMSTAAAAAALCNRASRAH